MAALYRPLDLGWGDIPAPPKTGEPRQGRSTAWHTSWVENDAPDGKRIDPGDASEDGSLERTAEATATDPTHLSAANGASESIERAPAPVGLPPEETPESMPQDSTPQTSTPRTPRQSATAESADLPREPTSNGSASDGLASPGSAPNVGDQPLERGKSTGPGPIRVRTNRRSGESTGGPGPERQTTTSPRRRRDPNAGSASAATAPSTGQRILRRWVVPALLALVLGGITGALVAASIHIPDVESISDLAPAVITRVHDAQGRQIRTYHSHERRVMLRDGEVPQVFIDALLAMEDKNFYSHGGIDVLGIPRAMLSNMITGTRGQGASTITMQLAKQLFLSPEKTWRRKINQAVLATELEDKFTKQQILTLYANLMNMGDGNYGIEAASRDYFGKNARDLTVPEAATLVAILPRPSHWSPRQKPDLIRARRDRVIAQMLAEGYVTKEEHDAAVLVPLEVVRFRPKAQMGDYFSEEVRRYLYERFGEKSLYERGLQVRTTLHADAQRAMEDAVRAGLLSLDRRKGWRGAPDQVPDGIEPADHELTSWPSLEPLPGTWAQGVVLATDRKTATVRIGDHHYTLESAGYKWTRQANADRVLSPGDIAWFEFGPPPEPASATAATEDASTGENDPAAALSIDPAKLTINLTQEPELEAAGVLLESSSGAVRAMVGGWSFERNEFNRASQARRQVGSAYKPFVYGAALENGYTAADTLFDAPVVFAGADGTPNYSPRNFYRTYHGILTLRKALEKSANVTAVKIQEMIGADRVIDFSKRAGISTELQPYASLALGVIELSPLELAGAYASIANQGFYVEPYLIESVATQSGRLLEQHSPRASQAMEPEVAYVLTSMLEGVIDRGTGRLVAGLDLDLAGKTGTTDGYTDAWFAGFSPSYTLVVWVGYDKKRSIGRNMTGAAAALPIWKAIFERGIEEGWITRGERFVVPGKITKRWVDHDTGLLATEASPNAVEEAFIAGTEPTIQYEARWLQILGLPWYQQRPFYGLAKEGEHMPEDIEDWSLVEEEREARAGS